MGRFSNPCGALDQAVGLPSLVRTKSYVRGEMTNCDLQHRANAIYLIQSKLSNSGFLGLRDDLSISSRGCLLLDRRLLPGRRSRATALFGRFGILHFDLPASELLAL